MDIGLALPQFDGAAPGCPPLAWEDVVAWARAAEAAGFASVWLADRPDVTWLEPLTALAGLARVTTTIGLGTLVLDARRRPPAVLAKALATLDVLSGGRLVVGIGAGRAPAGPAERPGGREADTVPAEVLAEALQVLRGAFTAEPFSFRGRHVRVEGLRSRPAPRQRPAPPLWVGGASDPVLAVVARHGDGWSLPGWAGTVEGYRRRARALERACAAAGRDPASISHSVSRLALVAEDEAGLRRRWEAAQAAAGSAGRRVGRGRSPSLAQLRRFGLAGSVEDLREQAGIWAEAGVATLIVAVGALPFGGTSFDDLELLASASRP